MQDDCNKEQHCSCCSGDYSEIFSNTPSEKRNNQRMGIIYFIFLILATFNLYLGIVLLFLPFIFMIYKKKFSLQVLSLVIFAIIGIVCNRLL
ncbi:hypothetical protein [Caviibacter abscessus]|uniref:hypothetical protein n=1 Tax=Caviibacter abscessus TaxID=1766719 RepID=UPI00083060F3|nr:hypothetical protein [Caviibacter abscessus]